MTPSTIEASSTSMDRNVEEYLLALGFEKDEAKQALASSGTPSFDLVETILCRHSQQLPFCTMNHVLHYHFAHKNSSLNMSDELRSLHTAPLNLDTDSLVDRIVVHRKGGYCFEHNTLVHDVLKHLGYNVRQILARVVNSPLQVDPEKSSPRPGKFHCVTVLEFQHGDSELPSSYMVDAAFGDKGPTQLMPLPLPDDTSESTVTATRIVVDPKLPKTAGIGQQSRRIYKIVHNPSDPDPYALVTGYCDEGDFDTVSSGEKEFGSWFVLYKFNWHLEYAPIDAQVSHYYSHNSENGPFTQRFLVCRHVIKEPKDANNQSGDIHVLFNLNYRARDIHQADAIKEERKIQSPTELFELLNEVFAIKATMAECESLFMIFAEK